VYWDKVHFGMQPKGWGAMMLGLSGAIRWGSWVFSGTPGSAPNDIR